MITAMHALVYSDDAAATGRSSATCCGGRSCRRRGVRGVGLADLPVRAQRGGRPPDLGGDWSTSRQHTISLLCDDLEATVAELRGRGAVIEGEPADRPFGLCVMVEVPGADPIMLYQPKHRLAYGL